MPGWIKLSRDIISHWIWQDEQRLKWWLDLLLMAAYEKRKKFLKKEGRFIELQPGETDASYGFLAERWGVDKRVVRRFIELLEADGMVYHQAHHSYAIITICNYDKYQDVESEECTTERTPGGITDSTPDSTTERTPGGTQIKNIRSKERKEVKKDITPPSLRSGGSSDLQSNPEAVRLNEDKFVKFFNDEMDAQGAIIPRIKSLGKTRRTHVEARCREHGKDALAQMVRKAARSNFLNGHNKRGWKATFDWLILPTNFPKVIEGTYDNDTEQIHNTTSNNDPKPQDRYTKRRGADSTARSAEDYTDEI